MGRYQFPNLTGRIVAGDFEATGLQYWKGDHAFGLAVAYRDCGTIRSHYFDLRYPEALAWAQTALVDVKLWVNHYIKYDCHMARESGIRYPRARTHCTMIREALIDENKYEYGLDVVAIKYLKRGKVKEIYADLARMFGGAPTREAQIQNLANAPESMVSPYAQEDAVLALEVWEAQQPILETEDLLRVHALEMRLLQVIIDMERDGIRVDTDRAMQAHRKLNMLVRDTQKMLDQLAGYPVNANSGPQVHKLLGVHRKADGYWYTADDLKLESNPASRTEIKKAILEERPAVGSPSLDSVKMQQCKLPAAQMIVDLRGLIKARDTFIEQYMLNMSHNGYVHASFNQTRTEDGNGIYTGRISISEPALQQIHKRNKVMAAIIRACFIPDEDTEWVCYDWSQMDFRMFAHFLRDIRINEAYEKDPDTDFHALAAQITGLPRDRDQKTGGANAKQVNLACVFGMGAGELAKQCNLPYTVAKAGYLVAGPEAKAMFGKYHQAIPGVRKLQNSVESVAKSRGHITTQLGRRIRFPHGHGAHKAAGLLYQATAADAMKVKAVEVYEALASYPEYPGRLGLLVHDEFDHMMTPAAFDMGVDRDIRELLQRFDGDKTPLKFRIPIRADFGRGSDWWLASK